MANKMEALKARQMVRHLARPMEALKARQMVTHLARPMEGLKARPMEGLKARPKVTHFQYFQDFDHLLVVLRNVLDFLETCLQ